MTTGLVIAVGQKLRSNPDKDVIMILAPRCVTPNALEEDANTVYKRAIHG